MQTFICFLRWTDEAARQANDVSGRHSSGRQLAEKVEGRLLSTYVTTGQYDVVATREMPNADAMAKFVAALNALGAARTTSSLA